VAILVIDRVQAHVGLGEAAEVADRHPPRAGLAHLERNQPDVAGAVEHVRADAGREEPADPGRIDRPVQEGQVVPVLPRQGSPAQLGRDGVEVHAAIIAQ